jgi:hypothetical protein
MYNNINTYTIVDYPYENKTFGLYKSSRPKIAANRAFTDLIKFIDGGNEDDAFLGKFIVFIIRNTETLKEYKYIGTRIKLKNPVKNYKNGKEMIYKYKDVIGKYNPELDKIIIR